MPQVFSFDDKKVGKNAGDYFKITGVKDHPQRIAVLPAEIVLADLEPPAGLAEKAKTDPVAAEKFNEITDLKKSISLGLQKKPPSAEVWVNEKGEKVILYSKITGAMCFYIKGAGYILDKPDIPEKHKGQYGAQMQYWAVVLEYETDGMQEGNVRRHTLDQSKPNETVWNYSIVPWQFNDPKANTLKEHTGRWPLVKTDYTIWIEKQGTSDRMKVAPCAECVWREDPEIMKKVVLEARKRFQTLMKNAVKDYSADEVSKMFPELASSEAKTASQSEREIDAKEVNFHELLGVPTEAEAKT